MMIHFGVRHVVSTIATRYLFVFIHLSFGFTNTDTNIKLLLGSSEKQSDKLKQVWQ